MYREETEACVAVHLRLTSSSRKFDSALNRKLIVDRIQTFGVYPSDTAVVRAIAELIIEGAIHRTDGGNNESDAAAAATAKQRRLNQIAAQPLTETDFDTFVRLVPSELGRRYYSEPEFAVKYDRACKDWGFRVPPKPLQLKNEVPVESDSSQWRTLDAKTYHSIPTAKTVRLYQTDAGFKRAVDRLIEQGSI